MTEALILLPSELSPVNVGIGRDGLVLQAYAGCCGNPLKRSSDNDFVCRCGDTRRDTGLSWLSASIDLRNGLSPSTLELFMELWTDIKDIKVSIEW